MRSRHFGQSYCTFILYNFHYKVSSCWTSCSKNKKLTFCAQCSTRYLGMYIMTQPQAFQWIDFSSCPLIHLLRNESKYVQIPTDRNKIAMFSFPSETYSISSPCLSNPYNFPFKLFVGNEALYKVVNGSTIKTTFFMWFPGPGQL